MSKYPIISNFSIVNIKFSRIHENDSLQVFNNECIGYIIKGKGKFLCNGKILQASEGELLYIPTGTRYYSIWEGEPEIEFYSIAFKFLNQDEFSNIAFQKVSRFYEKDLLLSICEYEKENHMKSVGYFYVFLADLMQNLTKKNPSGVLFQIEPALKYLEENYTKEIKIEYLAELCGYSQSRFFSLFKNAVNCSPITYKNTLTIQKAIELLKNTNKPIEEISESLGFESTRYFRKIFKNITGKTPRELR